MGHLKSLQLCGLDGRKKSLCFLGCFAIPQEGFHVGSNSLKSGMIDFIRSTKTLSNKSVELRVLGNNKTPLPLLATAGAEMFYVLPVQKSQTRLKAWR
jgi:hypothetical protein